MPHRDGLTIHDLRFHYPGLDALPPTAVMEGASFSLPEEGIGAIIGASDSGKTTLLRILSGLVPRFSGGSLSGTARYAGLDLLQTMPYDAMETVGIVFQNPDEQLVTTRCDSEIAFALESLGIARQDMDSRISASLRLVGLEALRHRNPGTLSGGEKKRLLIACLAALDPKLWLLDEVFQELDTEWRTALLGHLRVHRRTALFLDSRWSSLYAGACSAVSVLGRGVLIPALSPGAVRDRQVTDFDPLVKEGLLLRAASGAPEPMVGPASGIPRVRMESVEFAFPGESSFCLTIDELRLGGQGITAIVGRNGSGKSTLGRLLCGLLVPRKGRITLMGERSSGSATPETLRRRVGFLFQNPDYQIFLPTVQEEIAFGLRFSHLSQKERAARVEEAIATFRLPGSATPPALMSYGARRRLQAATFATLRRDLLILDEVDSGLAYPDIFALLAGLRAADRDLVIITHDVALARQVASRIIVMEAGRVAEDLDPGRFGSLDARAGGGG